MFSTVNKVLPGGSTLAFYSFPPMSILSYYNDLAPTYDANRFANSYGDYLHRQERRVLDRYLGEIPPERTLDLACGTGRHLDYAATGVDLSPAMIDVCREKHPGKTLHVGDALATGLPGDTYDAILSFHFLMHLRPADLECFLAESHRLLRPGGRLIFDVPSAERRGVVKRMESGWHGDNAYGTEEVRNLYGTAWREVGRAGIALFPVHRLPEGLRPVLRPLDSFLCSSPLGRVASYCVYVLEKR